jgi:iron complex transport system permease protein
MLIGLWVGAAPVSPLELLSGRLTGDEAARAREILFGLRLPRVLLAALVGAALSASGVTFQAILRNPLADPFILGISGGAALGAILVAALGLDLAATSGAAAAGSGGLASFLTVAGSSLVRPLAAFAGSALTLLLLLTLSRFSPRGSNAPMLLTGVVVNAFFSAVILFVITVVDYTRFQRVFFWLVGSLEPPAPGPLAATALACALGLAGLIALSSRMNLLVLGEDEAHSLGIDPEKTKRRAILAASLLTAAAVSLSGLIGFVGLMVPHAARALFGSDNRVLVPVSALGGAAFLVLADTLARTLLAPVEMPVGILTAVCGGPFFLFLFHRRQRGAA